MGGNQHGFDFSKPLWRRGAGVRFGRAQPAAGGGIPSTAILETFTDTDGVDLDAHSANWTPVYNNAEIQGNACAGTVLSDSNIVGWNASTFGPDCEVYCTITDKTGNSWVYLGIRLTTLVLATLDGYNAGVDFLAGTDQLEIYELLDGGGTLLDSVTLEITAGDVFVFRAVGTDLRIYINGISQLDTTDATYGSAGNIYIDPGSTDTRLDDFGGGTL